MTLLLALTSAPRAWGYQMKNQCSVCLTNPLCVSFYAFSLASALFGVLPQLRSERTGKHEVRLGFCHTVINNQAAPERNTTITTDTSSFEWKDHVPLALLFPTTLLQTVIFTLCPWLSQWCWLKIIYCTLSFHSACPLQGMKSSQASLNHNVTQYEGGGVRRAWPKWKLHFPLCFKVNRLINP